MKTKAEIAKTILEYRTRMSHVIQPNDIATKIGPDGLAEALRSRWLVADTESSGYLQVTQDMRLVDEMTSIAAEQPKPAAQVISDSHNLAVQHSLRTHLVEVAAPMTGQPSPGLSSIAQPQPLHNTTPAEINVGTPVTVAREGKRFTGMVDKLLPDGRYQVSFEKDKPTGEPVFSKAEMSTVPNTPAGQMPPPPALAK